MAYSLQVTDTISSNQSASQVVTDSQSNPSCLKVGVSRAFVNGVDTVGGSYPLWIFGNTTPQNFQNGTTFGRILRLADQGTSGNYYDFGVDVNGNLFIAIEQGGNGFQEVFLINPQGQVFMPNLPQAGTGWQSLQIDSSTGQLGIG